MKVSIAIYSTFKSGGYKSVQIQKIIKAFKSKGVEYQCYSIAENLRKGDSIDDKVIHTKLPLLITWVYNKFKLFNLYNSYFNYLLGEYLYYLRFVNHIINDDSEIIILKNRPNQLIKSLRKRSSKYLIIEVDQLHPYFTKDVLLREYQIYGIKISTIYSNLYAIDSYVSSYNLADLLIVYSDFQRNQLIAYGVKTNIKVVDLGCENIFPAINKTIEVKGDVFFICFAHHTFVKGTHRLIEIWSKLPGKFTLFILGSLGEDMKEYLRNNKFDSNIKFINKFNSVDLFEFIRGKRVVGISPSLSDSYNRVLSEYLELGLPVIVSEILDRGISIENLGRVVDIYDSQDVINAINFLSEKKTYDSIRLNCIKHNLNEATKENKYGQKYLDIIMSLK